VFFARPWLKRPAASYQYYELFFHIPYGLLAWIFSVRVLQTLAKAFGGMDSFASTLNVLGITIFTPFIFIDTIDALFMILNPGDRNIVFNSITRIVYVL